jgi:Ca2+-binding EF-hand superfamily protein
LQRIFGLLDTTEEGRLDIDSLISGFMPLCTCTPQEKVEAIFSGFDINNDGFITMNEMQASLLIFFVVLFELWPANRATYGDVGVSKLAEQTAATCFAAADANQDGKISYQEFIAWFHRDPTAEASPLPADATPATNLKTAWAVATNLIQYNPSTMMNTLAHYQVT